jgi:hypothetical protein
MDNVHHLRQNAGETMTIQPDPNLFRQALKYGEVEGIDVIEVNGQLRLDVSGVYETKEAMDKLLNGLVLAFLKSNYGIQTGGQG